MFTQQGWEQFFGYVRYITTFFIEVFKHPKLIPIFVIYLIACCTLMFLFFKLLVKIKGGCDWKEEISAFKERPINIFFLGLAIFFFLMIFIYVFYWVCSSAGITLPPELIEIQQRLS